MTKLEERYADAEKRAMKLLLKEFPNLTKVEAMSIIMGVLKHARMYKYQKVLMMVELMQNTTDGEFQ